MQSGSEHRRQEVIAYLQILFPDEPVLEGVKSKQPQRDAFMRILELLGLLI